VIVRWSTAIDDELPKRRRCQRLCEVKYAPDGSTRLVVAFRNDTILANGSIVYRGGHYEIRPSDLVLRPD
jgi:hypothetical protein